MNKLHLPGTVWLASDMHLGLQSPHTNRAFLSFLSQAAQQADALVLGGDIFNVWVGDDSLDAPPAWLAELLAALQHTRQSIPLYLCRGNRDFLMGQRLCDHIGATLLGDQTRLQTDAGTLLFSHGDEYCTDDRAYQRFRKLVRTPWIQSVFLTLGLPMRRGVADWARQR
ncbi:MAG: UDP-2,3-diacylglucosamine diphosphatase, partial [Pusillimonas sp.]